MTKQQKRDFLKQQGWRREDRATGPNQSQELWLAPGMQFGVSLAWAYKKATSKGRA